MSRLWKRLRITVDFDDPELAAELPAKAAFTFSDFVLTPTTKGVLLRRGSGQAGVAYGTSRTLLHHITECRTFAEKQAGETGGSTTATGRYHLDRAAFWLAVNQAVLEHRRWLWPAEAA